jgi:hypothetical protein
MPALVPRARAAAIAALSRPGDPAEPPAGGAAS